jgi:hypothetical protein
MLGDVLVGNGLRTLLVVIKQDEHGQLRALAGTDLTRLPCFDIEGLKGTPARTAAVARASVVMRDLLGSEAVHCVLAHDDGRTRVVACPLLGSRIAEHDLNFACWLSLPEVSETGLFHPVGCAFSHISTYLAHSKKTTLELQGTRGARGLAPLLPVPLSITPDSARWALRVGNT